MTGKFIVVEGADGTGKSTQAGMLVEYLLGRGHTVVDVREPGGTKLGESIRSVLRNPGFRGMSAQAEMFLYMASRAQLVREVIEPALAEGSIVVADRFLLSTVAYQGAAGGLGVEIVKEIGKVATGGMRPSLTIVIDVNEKKWLLRKGFQRDGAQVGLFEEPPDREELKGLEFHKKVRDAYLELARNDDLSVVVDGSGTPQQVHEKIAKVVEDALR